MTKWICVCNAINAELAIYCHNCNRVRENIGVIDYSGYQSVKDLEIQHLKQQILDAENVIREMSKDDYEPTWNIQRKYWEKYGKK